MNPSTSTHTENIMVVDDQPDTVTTTQAMLTTVGYATMHANSADECLEKIRAQQPDLILLDIMMPGMPVSELLDMMQAEPDLQRIRVLFFTAVTMTPEEKKVATKRPQVFGVIDKPFSKDELLKKVSDALKKKVTLKSKSSTSSSQKAGGKVKRVKTGGAK